MAERGSSGRSAKPTLRRLGLVGLAVVTPLALLLTLWPTHLLLRAKPRVVRGIEWFHAREMFEWLYWTRLEVFANVAMLVPIALLLTFVLGWRRWWIAVAACAAASIGVEVVQHFMPNRVSSTMDIVANSLGGLIGALLAVAIELAALRARRSSMRRSAHRWHAENR